MGGQIPDTGTHTDPLPSRIAALVHAHFDGLPKRSKPVIRDDGTAEWIPMTGIVLVKGGNTPNETLTCVAVTSGAKCLPASQIPSCNGLVLHDYHAEILAMRAFNYWLLSECHSVLAAENSSPEGGEERKDADDVLALPYIRRRLNPKSITATPPFELCPDVNIYMYCTCAPCGDASMELIMAAQDDPTPWVLPSTSAPAPAATTTASKSESEQNEAPTSLEDTLLQGRGHFSQLGIVRRKPARADAESTKSKSCSDKLALRQVTSLLSHQMSRLVAVTENAYIRGLVMPEEEITRVGLERCFGRDGRMKGLKGRMWPVSGTGTGAQGVDGYEEDGTAQAESDSPHQYTFHPFTVLSTPNTQLRSLWAYRKPKASDPVDETQPKKTKPGTISTVWIRAPTIEHNGLHPQPTLTTDNGSKNLPALRGSKTGLFENIIGGVRQGNKASSPGLRGASALSRARMWEFWRRVAKGVDCQVDRGQSALEREGETETETYHDFKEQQSMDSTWARKQAMQAAKEVLDGWVPNSGDEDWGWRLDNLVDSKGVPVGEAPKKRKR